MRSIRLLLILSLLSMPWVCSAIHLRANAPKRYVVREGDTLWEIAGKFLDKPWEWKKIWHSNPQVKNPNRIYPGAVLAIRYQNGQPYLVMTRHGTYKLSPQARPQPSFHAIPTIPLGAIKPFLDGAQVMDDDQLSHAPYVVAYAEKHLLAGPGVEVFVKNLPPSKQKRYAFFRPDGEYVDPITHEFLGYIARYIGHGDLIEGGNPAVIAVADITRGVRVKDRVLSSDHQDFEPSFEPQAPNKHIVGEVIDLFGGATQIGTSQVVVVNRGKREGLEPGDVLSIYQLSRTVADPIKPMEKVHLPGKRIGEVMVFRTFSKVSFGLVLRASEPVRRHYAVLNP